MPRHPVRNAGRCAAGRLQGRRGAEYSGGMRNFSPYARAPAARVAIRANIRERIPTRSLLDVRHIDCTTSQYGAHHAHEHCDLANDLGLPLEPVRPAATRRRRATAGAFLGVRQASGKAARCHGAGVRGVRILGEGGSRRRGIERCVGRGSHSS